MPTHISEIERAYYQSQLSSTDVNLSTLKRTFFLTELGESSGATPDLEKRWLRAQGSDEGHVADMWMDFLLKSGYSGNLQEMLRDYWIANT